MLTIGNKRSIDKEISWDFEEPAKDARKRIPEILHEMYDKDWRVDNVSIGKRRNIGVFSYYRVEWWQHPRKGWIGGSMDVVFRFLNDMNDASLQSSEL